ncbi:MAG: hypothetical protein ACE5O2_15595 [Armatimonadota bacterium]
MTWCPRCARYVAERTQTDDLDEGVLRIIIECSRCNITLAVTELSGEETEEPVGQ